MCYPRPNLDLGGHRRDRPIRDAEENELRVRVANAKAALGEPSAHRGADAATRAHDSDALDHCPAPVTEWDTGQPECSSHQLPRRKPCFETHAHSRPVVVDNAVPSTVSVFALAHEHVLAMYPLEGCAEGHQGSA